MRRPLLRIPLIPIFQNPQRLRRRQQKPPHQSPSTKKRVRMSASSRHRRPHLLQIPRRPLCDRNFVLAHSAPPIQIPSRCTPATP
jgi:hypothetical protein